MKVFESDRRHLADRGTYTGTLAVDLASTSSEPQFSIQECREKDLTYQAPL